MATDSRVLAPAAPVPRRADPPGPSWRARIAEQTSAYLPLLLMALLALGTVWLVKNTPSAETARSAAPLRHEPDYTMTGFMVQRFMPSGALGAQIEGDMLRHYPDSDTLEIDNARIRHVGPEGRVTLASARRALSNGDGSEVQLQGGARVTRQGSGPGDSIEFRGEFLQAFLATERVSSPLPVTMTRGATEISADAMTYDNLDRVVQLKGRVRASFPPSPARVRR